MSCCYRKNKYRSFFFLLFFTARGPQLRSFSDKSESGIFFCRRVCFGFYRIYPQTRNPKYTAGFKRNVTNLFCTRIFSAYLSIYQPEWGKLQVITFMCAQSSRIKSNQLLLRPIAVYMKYYTKLLDSGAK